MVALEVGALHLDEGLLLSVKLGLHLGDALLLQGSAAKMQLLVADPDFVLLTPGLQEPRRTNKAPFALAGLAIMITLVALNLYPIQVAAFVAARPMGSQPVEYPAAVHAVFPAVFPAVRQ